MHVWVDRDPIHILQTLGLRELGYPRGIRAGHCTAQDARLRICRLDALSSGAQQIDVGLRIAWNPVLGWHAQAVVPFVPDLEVLRAALEVRDRKCGIFCERVDAAG